MRKRKGFAGLFFLLILAIIALKIFLVYRAWCLVEEKTRHDMGLPPKETPTEFIFREVEKLREPEREQYERLKQKLDSDPK